MDNVFQSSEVRSEEEAPIAKKQHQSRSSSTSRGKPDTNALSPPDDIYCLLRVPTTYPGLLDFAGRSKKYLRHRAAGCFTIADSLRACHSCLSTTTSYPKLAIAEVVHFIYPVIISCREHSALKVGDTFGNRFEVD